MRNQPNGMALLTVIFIMVVLGVLATGAISLFFSGNRSSIDEYRYDKAFYIAEAGKNFGIKYLNSYADWSQSLGFPLARDFGGGTFLLTTVNATAEGVSLYSQGTITFEGKSYSRRVKVDLQLSQWGFIGDYVLYWGGAGGEISTTIANGVTINGDVFIDGSVTMGNTAIVNGELQTTGTSTGGTVNGTRQENVTPPSNPPSIDTTYYAGQIAIADGFASSSPSWGSRTISEESYIHGDLNMNGSFTVAGQARIVVTGGISLGNGANISVPAGAVLEVISGNSVTFNNNVSVGTGSSGGNITFYSNNEFVSTNNVLIGNATKGAVFICPNNLANFANNTTFYGLLYCGGVLTIANNANFYGNIIANDVSVISNNATLTIMPNLVDLNIIQGLQGGVETKIVSWREEY